MRNSSSLKINGFGVNLYISNDGASARITVSQIPSALNAHQYAMN